MFLLFDIGGTKTRLALSRDGTTYDTPVKFDTPANFDEAVAKMGEVASSLTDGAPLTRALGGIAGPLSRARSTLGNAPNLPAWSNAPVRERLSEIFRAPVTLENDSAVVALGEAHDGAGKGFSIVAYLTISTGVGGARIVDGRIDKSAMGFEPGHQIIDLDGTLCPVCHAVDAEGLLSGTATAIRFGKKAYEVTDPAIWEELARWLAVVVNNTCVYWSPDVVVLGGSMVVGNPAISVARVESHLRDILKIFSDVPPIRPAQLKDEGGLHGALRL